MRSINKGESGGDADLNEPRLSRASVGRLSLYLRFLEGLLRDGSTTVSSSDLGSALSLTDAQVRRDLAYLGSLGQPGIGYKTQQLISAIRRVLGIDRDWRVAVAGVGNLARALLRYRGFAERGFRIVALFDVDPAKIGEQLDGLTVHAVEEMREVIKVAKAELGIMAVPAEAAQAVADAFIAAGICGLLNFAPAILRLPRGISLVSVDLTVQLEQLAFRMQLNGSERGEQRTTR